MKLGTLMVNFSSKITKSGLNFFQNFQIQFENFEIQFENFEIIQYIFQIFQFVWQHFNK